MNDQILASSMYRIRNSQYLGSERDLVDISENYVAEKDTRIIGLCCVVDYSGHYKGNTKKKAF